MALIFSALPRTPVSLPSANTVNTTRIAQNRFAEDWSRALLQDEERNAGTGRLLRPSTGIWIAIGEWEGSLAGCEEGDKWE